MKDENGRIAKASLLFKQIKKRNEEFSKRVKNLQEIRTSVNLEKDGQLLNPLITEEALVSAALFVDGMNETLKLLNQKIKAMKRRGEEKRVKTI